MKLKITTNYVVLAFLALPLISCDDKASADPLFDATATERINARTKELDNVLKSSPDGWKAIYYTDNTQLGAFTHLFKFNNDGTVDMASDYNNSSITPARSRYSIDVGSTVSLVFTTKNWIHLLSDSDNYPTDALRGQGYKGDFQFLYYGQENGQIIFRTNRSFQELRFVRATTEEWSNLLAANRTMSQNLIGAPTRPLFRILEINDGTTVRRYDFNLTPLARFATAQSINVGSNEVIRMAIKYTPTAVNVSPAIEVGGQKLTNFSYNTDTGEFTAGGTNGVSAILKYSNIPPVLTDNYQFLLPGRPSRSLGYIAADLGTVPTNSQLFRILEQQVNMTRAIERVEFYFNRAGGQNYIRYQLAGATFHHYVNVIEDPVNKTIKLVHVRWNEILPGNILGPVIPRPIYLGGLDDQLITPAGLWVKRESFRVRFTNTIYTFTNINSFRITVYLF